MPIFTSRTNMLPSSSLITVAEAINWPLSQWCLEARKVKSHHRMHWHCCRQNLGHLQMNYMSAPLTHSLRHFHFPSFNPNYYSLLAMIKNLWCIFSFLLVFSYVFIFSNTLVRWPLLLVSVLEGQVRTAIVSCLQKIWTSGHLPFIVHL